MVSKNTKEYLKVGALPLLLLTVGFLGVFWVNVESIKRLTYSPHIQKCEEIASELSSGRSLEIFNGEKLVDIEASLSPYVLVFDKDKNIRYSSARYKGKVPEIPGNLIEGSSKVAEKMWEPEKGLKQIILVRKYEGKGGGYVVVGKLAAEMSYRVSRMTKVMIFLWVLSASIIFLAIYIESKNKSSRRK